ncbi:hypothetical protein QE152_g36051 [Popillia japonica]|uniref:Uncharacterized protein n=1 Tax=Popillia japonica TaxID=7064 RepID=A0AAW1IEF3_POPJA
MLINLHSLRVIERGSFRDMPNLTVVHISQATQLTYLNGLFDGVTSSKLRVVKIVKNFKIYKNLRRSKEILKKKQNNWKLKKIEENRI